MLKMSQATSLMGGLAARRGQTTGCGHCHQTESEAESEGKIYNRTGDWCV